MAATVPGGQKHRRRADDWDVYWRGTHDNAAHREGGPQESVLAAFWEGFFGKHRRALAAGRMLDLACGNGAVTGYARRVMPDSRGYCADYSSSALLELIKRYPGSRCVVTDARHVPFPERSFDLVVSQFGVEYAGPDALLEAARLVAPGGSLGVVLHLHGGGIYRECATNLEAVEAIQRSEIMPLAKTAFSAGFALNAGRGSGSEFKAAEQAFAPAVRRLEELLRQWGNEVADGLPQQLYRDIAHMYRRMSAYEPEDVMNWVDGMVVELAAYAGRMSSMLEAALPREKIDDVCSQLQRFGMQQLLGQTLDMGATEEPAAWAVVLERRESD
jgi:ubiquinone/menaquinone biosynthesis C-methylase UbiE